MAEITRELLVSYDTDGYETVTFGEDHTLSDIARYFVNDNQVDAEELVRLITEMLDG